MEYKCKCSCQKIIIYTPAMLINFGRKCVNELETRVSLDYCRYPERNIYFFFTHHSFHISTLSTCGRFSACSRMVDGEHFPFYLFIFIQLLMRQKFISLDFVISILSIAQANKMCVSVLPLINKPS